MQLFYTSIVLPKIEAEDDNSANAKPALEKLDFWAPRLHHHWAKIDGRCGASGRNVAA